VKKEHFDDGISVRSKKELKKVPTKKEESKLRKTIKDDI
jgi:hypothetical protein